MIDAHTEFLDDGVRRSRFGITCAEALRRWCDDEGFRERFIATLAEAPFPAFRWETPAVTSASLDRPFEFVLLDCPSLDRRPDEHAFAEHFRPPPEDGIAVFPNLGHDAVLVTPSPQAAPSAYAHLGVFTREAPVAQNHALWQIVGSAMHDRVGPRPVWLSTAGMGVSWVHVRLDDRPKYYGHAPYRAG